MHLSEYPRPYRTATHLWRITVAYASKQALNRAVGRVFFAHSMGAPPPHIWGFVCIVYETVNEHVFLERLAHGKAANEKSGRPAKIAPVDNPKEVRLLALHPSSFVASSCSCVCCCTSWDLA